MAIQICAGLAVFVCDNLAFRGDMIALKRKHTSGLHLAGELSGAVLRFQDHFGTLTAEIETLKNRELSDKEAKGRCCQFQRGRDATSASSIENSTR